ncbi:MAG: bile acid:sodium symporter family protein [Woeseiaceae bacterium]
MDISELDQLRIVLDPFGQIALALALMLLMFSIALNLSAKDFYLLLQRRVLLLGGVFAQIAALPLVTYLLVLLIEPAPSIALGMFVVACCPGGVVSNYFTYLAAGNVAYSVSLTAISSVLAAVLTPMQILFWSQAYAPTAMLLESIEFSPLSFLAQTTMLLVIPLVAGMLVVARDPGFARRLQKRVAMVGSIALVAAIIIGSIKFLPILLPAMPMLVGITVLHNAAALATGAVAGLVLRADTATRRALVFEVGIQNSGLALVILLAQFQGLGGAAAMAAVWSLWHLIAGTSAVTVMRRYNI